MMRSIYDKLQVHSKSEAVSKAMRASLIYDGGKMIIRKPLVLIFSEGFDLAYTGRWSDAVGSTL